MLFKLSYILLCSNNKYVSEKKLYIAKIGTLVTNTKIQTESILTIQHAAGPGTTSTTYTLKITCSNKGYSFC